MNAQEIKYLVNIRDKLRNAIKPNVNPHLDTALEIFEERSTILESAILVILSDVESHLDFYGVENE